MGMLSNLDGHFKLVDCKLWCIAMHFLKDGKIDQMAAGLSRAGN